MELHRTQAVNAQGADPEPRSPTTEKTAPAAEGQAEDRVQL